MIRIAVTLLSVAVLLRLGSATNFVMPFNDVQKVKGVEQSEPVRIALDQLGSAYRSSGENPTEGFDCSGLVYYAFLKAGRQVGRSSRDQAMEGKPVSKEQIAVGDVVVFSRPKTTRIFHSGLVVHSSPDSLIMIHANKRQGVHLTNISTSTYWAEKLYGARRL